jgi:hypothetical protein
MSEPATNKALVTEFIDALFTRGSWTPSTATWRRGS